MKREKVNYSIQSVSHALDILESFTRTEDELGVTELSKRLGLHKNNVFRLLATLEYRGYIEQNPATENYRLGVKTLQIGSIFIEQRECRRQARPILENLMAACGETTVVAVLRGNKIIYMDGVETDKTVRAVSHIGALLPAHCTAVGKVQLAQLSTAEIERLYPDQTLSTLTDRSIKRRDTLMVELKSVADQGYSLENEECEADVRGISVAVKDYSKNVIAAIGITAPVSRLTDERLEKGGIINLLRDSGQALSSKLGFIAVAART
ncbi:MAG TPA: IclR family transcriptional regulator [Nitrospirota bacterium]|nr:IclR family transcriptional regulator [Nitrospirota bacterium]